MTYTEKIVGNHMITKGPSIFTSRNNASVCLEDITVQQHVDGVDYGVHRDGRYYNQVCILDAQTGSIIRGNSGAVTGLPSDVARIVKQMIGGKDD